MPLWYDVEREEFVEPTVEDLRKGHTIVANHSNQRVPWRQDSDILLQLGDVLRCGVERYRIVEIMEPMPGSDMISLRTELIDELAEIRAMSVQTIEAQQHPIQIWRNQHAPEAR